MKQYSLILNFMADGEWHKTSEITEILGLKDTRTKELLKELVSLDKLVDDGKTKGKQYRLNNSSLKKRRKKRRILKR